LGEELCESDSATNGVVTVNSFSGGALRGTCYQITQGTGFGQALINGHVQLTTPQAIEICSAILAHLAARGVDDEGALRKLDTLRSSMRLAGVEAGKRSALKPSEPTENPPCPSCASRDWRWSGTNVYCAACGRRVR